MPTVFELVNKVMQRSGYSTVTSGQISTPDTYSNKIFNFFQLAWDTFLGTNPSWSFNEPMVISTLNSGSRSVTLPSTVNLDFIDDIYLTDANNKKFPLVQTGAERAEKENNFLEVDSLTSTPFEWYLQNGNLYFTRFADQDYTVNVIGQKLPEEFDITQTETTNLPINRTQFETVVNMTLYRIQDTKKDNGSMDTWKKTEDLSNPSSMLRQTIAKNKLKEKQNTRRIQFKKGPSSYS